MTGTLGNTVLVGSEPTRLSLSVAGTYLYFILSGSNAVRRMDLTTLTPGTQFTTASTLFGPYSASDLAVMPGNSSALATVGYANGIQIWDVTNAGAAARPPTNTLANDVYEGSVLAWGSPANLYSNDEGLSPSSFLLLSGYQFCGNRFNLSGRGRWKDYLLRGLGSHRW